MNLEGFLKVFTTPNLFDWEFVSFEIFAIIICIFLRHNNNVDL